MKYWIAIYKIMKLFVIFFVLYSLLGGFIVLLE